MINIGNTHLNWTERWSASTRQAPSNFSYSGSRGQLTYMEFTLLSGICDIDFFSTPQYEQLLIGFPPGVTPKGLWLYLSHGQSYELAHRYVHAIIAYSFIGRVDNIGVVKW